MTNPSSPHEKKEAQVGAFLWIKSVKDQVAPDALGGQTKVEQEQIVQARMKRDGVAPEVFNYAVGRTPGTSDQRLDYMLSVLKHAPIKHLYVSSAVYADDSDDDVMKHHLMLVMRGTKLTLCDDE